MGDPDKPCLCFPCIINYLGGYVYPTSAKQEYPILQIKGFTSAEQAAIAEEWYWVAFERETAVHDYLQGYAPRDGCWWRKPPHPPHSSPQSTPGSTPPSGPST